MSNNRTIARVVFTATGERRPAKVGEWYQCGDGAFWCRVAEASLTDLDIYTRKVFYVPKESEGQAEPPTVDLRKLLMLATSATPGTDWDDVVSAIIDRIEAQEKSIKKHEDRLETLRRDIGAIERWVKGFETP